MLAVEQLVIINRATKCCPLGLVCGSRSMSLFRHVVEWGGVLRDLVYPPQCLACGGELVEQGPRRFCDLCRYELALFSGPYCDRCGVPRPFEIPGSKGCGHCLNQRFRFDAAIALGPYDGLLRDLVLATKRPHGELKTLGLGHLLMELRGEELRNCHVDVVCGVAMHWRRRLRRLACGPALLAELIARELRVPYAATLVTRRRSTVPQFQLPRSQRRQNVRRAFALGRGHRLNAPHVLLVDDILTTGATCSEIARVLKRGGARRVTVAVLARSFAGSDRTPTVPLETGSLESGLPVVKESQE